MTDTVTISRKLLERAALLLKDSLYPPTGCADFDDWTAQGNELAEQFRAILAAPVQEPLTQAAVGCFVQPIPAHCDRITWRGSYYHLPIAAQVQGVNMQLLESATESLDEIQAVMQEAYNSAMPVCCGRAQNECCGYPDQEWNEHDQRTMDRFAPIERALRTAIAAAQQEGGKV